MAWNTAAVLFVVVWFMMLFIVLPIRMRSQRDAGDVVPGTPPGAPVNPMMRRRLVWTTLASVVVWAGLVALISSGLISLDAIDLFR